MKRILLLFSALMLSCIALWAHDVEIGGIYYNLNETKKTAEVTYYGDDDYNNEYSGSVTIPETITYNSQTYRVTSIGSSAFSRCSGLTEVTIPNSVTSIGNEAFYYCSGLTSVTIGNSVTYIDGGAFYGCSGLTKVNYLGTVDKWVEIYFGSNPTYYANDLYINNELVTDVKITSAGSIGHDAFTNCKSIKSVEICNSVTSIGSSAFSRCSGLTEVTIPNSVTSIGNEAFYGCRGLTSVTIPNSVTSIGSSAFRGCRGLTSVTIGNSVTSIGPSAFYNTGIYNNNSNWDNGVLYIDNCLINAKSDVVKGSYTIKKGTRIIGYYAFYDCSGLTSITIPNSVTSIGQSAFRDCSGLTKVNYLGTVDKWVEIDFDDYDSNPTYYAKDLYINNELLADVKITTADSIKNYAFYNCQSIKSVEIGNSVTSIGDEAFDNCSGLTEILVSSNNDEFSSENGVLYNKDKTTLIKYPAGKKDTSFTIPNSVTSIGRSAFSGCSGLTSVTIPNSVTSIGWGAFEGCSGLTSVTIPNSVTSIGGEAFEGCSNLTSVTIPNSVTSIGDRAFYSCSGLTEVTIPNSVTSIDQYAFSDCSGLTSVSIGESVTSIGSSAFSGCDKLRKVTAYPTTVPNVYESSFAHYNAALYVPCDVYDDYFFDDVFGTFKVTECIAAEEVDAPEKIEIEVDEDNNAIVIWPSTDGAKKYELEISKDGEVFCTLLFNENGQLTSIDFGNRSASVGFQFTVTGLDSASKYAYSMVAMDKKGNELQSYKGTFTTNGYVPGPGEEDVPTSITETLADANITISNGHITCPDTEFAIYNTIGQDVTAFNGSLQPGVYLVSIENNIVKVMVH